MRTYDFLTVSDILQSRKGSVNWYVKVRIVMIMMMIGLSSCPVNTRSRREIKQREIFCPYFSSLLL